MTAKITSFPAVQLERRAGALALMINGERHVPLIMAFARTHYVARSKPDFDYTHDVVYDQMRRVYDAGLRLFQPCMPEIGWGPDGNFDYGHFDTVMRRLVEEMPGAYFILRVIIPPPPIPQDEQILVSRRPGDTSDAEACQVFDQISLFSETYRAYAPGAMTRIMAHLAALPEAGRIIGTVICGAGFEWNWGNPGGNWGLMMDICPAVTREFGRFLQKKYGTVESLRAAWGDPTADFAHPPLPGIEERTHSDIGGFRDPAQPRSRWIQDFLDCYNDHPTRMLITIFDQLAPFRPEPLHQSLRHGAGQASTLHPPPSTFPPLFHGVFGMAVMNTAYSGVQTMPSDNRPVLEHPALGFITCCLTYCDRKAGGVSVYMNAGYHSHTLHGKLALGEADIRPGTASDTWNETSFADGVASMRREFAAMLLCQRQGIWYFDMPGGWFDQPELLAELARQQQVGQALLDVPHTNVAETLVVYENRSWKYFGLADHKLELKTVWSGENQQLLSDMTQDNIENLQRLGAPHDAIVAEDFLLVAQVGPTCADRRASDCEPVAEVGSVCDNRRRAVGGYSAMDCQAVAQVGPTCVDRGVTDCEPVAEGGSVCDNRRRAVGGYSAMDCQAVAQVGPTCVDRGASDCQPVAEGGSVCDNRRRAVGGYSAIDCQAVAQVGPTCVGANRGDYKLLIFPFSFLCEPATRDEVHRRVEAGATALFLYAAGIVDGETASLENMDRLLGMKIRVEGPAPLAAELVEGADRQSSRQSSRQSGGEIGNPDSHHFRYVIDDPAATPLARYPDGKVAAAMVARGKGKIILAAVSAVSPAFYKLAARLAGVHLYSETDDALYASGEFLTLHTREAGAKRLRFPRVVSRVTDVFTGEVIARNVSEVTLNLPAKTTAVYRLGGDVP